MRVFVRCDISAPHCETQLHRECFQPMASAEDCISGWTSNTSSTRWAPAAASPPALTNTSRRLRSLRKHQDISIECDQCADHLKSVHDHLPAEPQDQHRAEQVSRLVVGMIFAHSSITLTQVLNTFLLAYQNFRFMIFTVQKHALTYRNNRHIFL